MINIYIYIILYNLGWLSLNIEIKGFINGTHGVVDFIGNFIKKSKHACLLHRQSMKINFKKIYTFLY